MTYKFFKTACFLLFLFFGVNLPAQTNDGPREIIDKTYQIVDKANVENIQLYIDALNNSNMKYHRLKNTRHTIIFQHGVKVELFSASEIIEKGNKINLMEYPEKFNSSRVAPVFGLGADNYIIEFHTSGGKHH